MPDTLSPAPDGAQLSMRPTLRLIALCLGTSCLGWRDTRNGDYLGVVNSRLRAGPQQSSHVGPVWPRCLDKCVSVQVAFR